MPRGFDKILGLNLTSLLGLADIKSFAKEVLKSFSGRTNFLEQNVFGFTNSLLYSLEESRKLRILSVGSVDIQKCQKFLPTIFFHLSIGFMDSLIISIY